MYSDFLTCIYLFIFVSCKQLLVSSLLVEQMDYLLKLVSIADIHHKPNHQEVPVSHC